jgi:hypothetical protein
MPDNKLRVILQADTSKFTNSLNKANKQMVNFGKKLTSVGKDLSLKLSLPIAAAGAASIKLATDFEESLNKVDVSFKDTAKQVREFSKTTLTQFGIAQGTALDMAAMFGDMGTSMGLTTQEAAKMSTSMVGLAGDLASFKNIKIEEATTALAAVFTGETESLKRLGIVMTEANLKQFALTQGITKNIKEMTQAEKTTLRYQFVMKSSANAQGDFARTQDGAANQMRIFTESLKELGANFGQVLLPAFTKIVKKANAFLKSLMNLDDQTKKTIIVVAGIAATIGPALIAIGKLSVGFGAVVKILPLVATGFKLLTTAMIANPIIAVAAAVVGLGIAVSNYSKKQKSARQQEMVSGKGIVDLQELIAKKEQQLVDLSKSKSKRKSQEARKIKRTIGIYKEQIDVLEQEQAAIDETTKSTDEYTKALENLSTTAETTTKSTRKKITSVGGITGGGLEEVTKTETVRDDDLSDKLGVELTKDVVKKYDPVAQLAASVSDSNTELAAKLDITKQTLSAKQTEMMVLAQQFNQQLAPIFESGLEQLATGIGGALGEAIATGGNAVQGLAVVLLNGIGNMASQLGQLAIGTGIAIEGIKKALQSLNPVVAVAAGIALVALGAFVKNKAASIGKGGGGGGGGEVPAFANGGIVSGPTLGLMGEYAGAKSNPEVIAPLNKLQGMIGDRQPQQVNVGGEFQIRGQDLIVALQRAEKQRGRIK